MKSFLNAAEVAKLLNVDRATVSRWIKKGVLKGYVTPHFPGVRVLHSLVAGKTILLEIVFVERPRIFPGK